MIEVALEHFNQLLGLTFKENKQFPMYRDNLFTYDVYLSNEKKGILVLDLFKGNPSREKDGIAGLTNTLFIHSVQEKSQPVVVINTFFNEDSSLLTIDNIATFFHERSFFLPFF